ncbi:MAG: hypothetical protein J5441_07615 [Clostridia bacterium]|nr:hypothetical protein [Clostridia bacterium]
MKQIAAFIFCLTLCVLAVAPAAAYAETYKPADTDITVTIDDTLWYVFTRDNIENNPELEEVGGSVEQMRKIFDINDAYIDAFVIGDDGDFLELIVVKKEAGSGVANLSNYSDELVADLAKEISGMQSIDDYSVYQNNGYKFVRLETVSTASDNITYNLCEYFTIVNRYVYSLKFQSVSKFNDEKYAMVKKIVDSVEFDVDETLKEDVERGVSVGKVALWAIVGAIGGGAVGGIIGFAVDRKKKAAKRASEEKAAVLNGVPYAGNDGFVKPEDYVESGGPVKPEGYDEADGFAKPDGRSEE